MHLICIFIVEDIKNSDVQLNYIILISNTHHHPHPPSLPILPPHGSLYQITTNVDTFATHSIEQVNPSCLVSCCQSIHILERQTLFFPPLILSSFGEGTGPILLDNLQCNGDEDTIFDCGHSGIGNHDCSNAEDAGKQQPPMNLCSGLQFSGQLIQYILSHTQILQINHRDDISSVKDIEVYFSIS